MELGTLQAATHVKCNILTEQVDIHSTSECFCLGVHERYGREQTSAHIDFSEEGINAKRNEDCMRTGDHKIRMSAG